MLRGGVLRPDERLLPSEAAWCPDCGAFREISATVDPERWQAPKQTTPPAMPAESS